MHTQTHLSPDVCTHRFIHTQKQTHPPTQTYGNTGTSQQQDPAPHPWGNMWKSLHIPRKGSFWVQQLGGRCIWHLKCTHPENPHTHALVYAHTPSGYGICVLHRASPNVERPQPLHCVSSNLGPLAAQERCRAAFPEPRDQPSPESGEGPRPGSAHLQERMGDLGAPTPRPAKTPPSPPAPESSPILIFTLWKTRSPSSSTAMLIGIRAQSPAEQPEPEPERPRSTRALRPTLHGASPGSLRPRAPPMCPPISPAQLSIGGGS